jgi:ADP-heptose:LPS heptosyltransferase
VRHPKAKQKVILTNFLSPGDIVMLTAAVRDLHRSNPGRFATDVRTACGPLWENNPLITKIPDADPAVRTITCEYPLIHRSNSSPWHFIHGFSQHLSATLKVPVTPTDFKGDIYLSTKEKSWMSQIQELTKEVVPFWVLVAGGKFDFTIKWWDRYRFQEVVDAFKGQILFVQVGENKHNHPSLRGVLDLRGKTDLRQLVRLVYHSQGVLCPVTLLMHLAAAVETPPGKPKNRPCVVIAGGREPAQWEAYPHHQFIHTNGALKCCDNGGCWKSRTVPLGDGDEKDKPEHLCMDPVHYEMSDSDQKLHSRSYTLPRCMDLITASEVARRIGLYFDGGTATYLSPHQKKLVAPLLTK